VVTLRSLGRRRRSDLRPRSGIAIVAALVCVATMAVRADAAEVAVRPTCNPTWQPVAHPRPDLIDELVSVDAAGADDVWAVGDWDNADPVEGGDFHTLAQHWDGTRWREIPTPDFDEESFFNTVSVVGPAFAWAGGSLLESDGLSPLIERWDGDTWFPVPTPTPHGEVTDISSLSSRDAWAVGAVLGTDRPLLLHWDGVSWANVPSPGLKDLSIALYGVEALGKDNAWAVGGASDGSRDAPVIEHWDGATWSIVTVLRKSAPAELKGVAGLNGHDVWAVGGPTAHGKGLALHWDGTTWSRVDIGAPQAGISLLGVAPVSHDDVWAVGRYQLDQSGDLIEHWNGTRWSTVVRKPNARLLWDVSVGPTHDLWAVGSAGRIPETSQIRHVCPGVVESASMQPASFQGRLGAVATWQASGAGQGDIVVHDCSGLESFPAQSLKPGDPFDLPLDRSGSYLVGDDNCDALSRAGVPPRISPSAGSANQDYEVRWSRGSPGSDLTFDVRVRPPGARQWARLFTRTTGPSTSFRPDGGLGVYLFAVRMTIPDGSLSGPWSPSAELTIGP
jgi:hypothetical protein